MNDMTWNSENLIKSFSGGIFSGGNLTIQAGKTATAKLEGIKATSHVCLYYTMQTGDERYNPNVFSSLALSYKNKTRDAVGVTHYITHMGHEQENEFIDALPSFDIYSGELRITNKGSHTVTLQGIKVVLAKKDITELIPVLEETVISVQVLHALLAWVSTLVVDRVETNVSSRLVTTPYIEMREFITIKNWEIDFKQSHLSDTELEQLCIEIGDTLTPIWWTSIGEHPQAYKFFTLTHPTEIHDNLTPSEVDEFRAMVRKESTPMTKLRILFEEDSWTDAEGQTITTSIPKLIFGGGYSVDGSDDTGKGFIEKRVDQFKISYITANNDEVAIIMDDNGGRLVNFDVQGGGGGGTLLNINLSDTAKYELKYVEGTVSLGIERDDLGRIVKVTPSKGTPFTVTY